MDTDYLAKTAGELLVPGKGLLAADESTGTMNKRLKSIDVPEEAEMRRRFRQLLLTAPGIEQYLSGVILYDTSIRNETDDGVSFPHLLAARGIVPGIKVDMGMVPLEHFPGEKVTQGLDGLAARFAEYYALGARFAKWRTAFAIGEGMPSEEAIDMNGMVFARYAAIAQAANIVPIVEPEVLYEGTHTIDEAAAATERVLSGVFAQLVRYRLHLPGVILKSSMVLAGNGCRQQSSPEEVADATLRTFRAALPEELAGIVFLSGGQTPKRATENLDAIARQGKQSWPITFSYSRALEEPVLAAWQGKQENTEAAQAELLKYAQQNSAAQQGKYEPAVPAQ